MVSRQKMKEAIRCKKCKKWEVMITEKKGQIGKVSGGKGGSIGVGPMS